MKIKPPTKREMLQTAVVVLAVLFLAYVWPTPYKYDRLGQIPVRTNRFTGAVERLTLNGWVQGGAPSLSSTQVDKEEQIPGAELEKIKCAYEVTNYGYLKCEAYNGSEWRVKELTARFIVWDLQSQVIADREYKLSRDYYSGGDPQAASEFSANLGFKVLEGQRWKVSITGAVGTKVR
jgi:hypothetical protein